MYMYVCIYESSGFISLGLIAFVSRCRHYFSTGVLNEYLCLVMQIKTVLLAVQYHEVSFSS